MLLISQKSLLHRDYRPPRLVHRGGTQHGSANGATRQARRVFYVRERIPSDVIAKARGLRIKLPSEAGGGPHHRPGLGAAKASLRTHDPAVVAKARHAAALAHLGQTWQAVREGPRPISRLTLK